MIALVSSTIFPQQDDVYGGERSVFDHATRLSQTVETVRSLFHCGLQTVIVADNSGRLWQPDAVARLAPATVLVFDHPQFRNRGLSESYLLLAALEHLPANEPILKLSGRYTLDLVPDFDSELDILLKFRDNHQTVSTRCYVTRNRDVLRQYLTGILQEVYGSRSRIVGPRSLIRTVVTSICPKKDDYPHHDPTVSIEWAGARVIAHKRWQVRDVASLHIQGALGLTGEQIVE